MVHGFVKQTGGHIRIYSEVNEGTTVKIYLPRLSHAGEFAANPEEMTQRAEPNELARASETILLVEDNEDVRQYAKSALEELEYKVLVAHDSAGALRIVDDGAHIDLSKPYTQDDLSRKLRRVLARARCRSGRGPRSLSA